jgi:hypothetical protein
VFGASQNGVLGLQRHFPQLRFLIGLLRSRFAGCRLVLIHLQVLLTWLPPPDTIVGDRRRQRSFDDSHSRNATGDADNGEIFCLPFP